jgi:mono/diheme cytochrome c family protein
MQLDEKLLPLPQCALPSRDAKWMPGRLETTLIRWTEHHLTVGGKGDKNSLRATGEAVEEGKQAFGFYCVVCHGLDGQSTGVPFAANMSPDPIARLGGGSALQRRPVEVDQTPDPVRTRIGMRQDEASGEGL